MSGWRSLILLKNEDVTFCVYGDKCGAGSRIMDQYV